MIEQLRTNDSRWGIVGLRAAAVVLSAVMASGAATVACADERLTNIMFHDPHLPGPQTLLVLPDRLHDPWLRALHRPEPELQRITADSIALAHRYGHHVWDDAVDRLVELAGDGEADTAVRRAAARALVTMDARRAAPVLYAVMQSSDLDLASVAAPALARWNHQAARGAWLAMLTDPDAERARLRQAIEGLRVCRDENAVEPLLRLVNDAAITATIRLSAARAAGSIPNPQSTASAAPLVSSEVMVDRLLGVTLLARQDDDAVPDLLLSAADDPAAVVAGIALRRLFELDPTRAYTKSRRAIERDDVNIRRVGAELLVHEATPEAMESLASLLADHNPSLRRYASDSMIQLADKPALHETIVRLAVETLEGDDWRAVAQSAVIAGALDVESTGPRLLVLLNHRRQEVQAASAWALRKILVKEHFPPMLAHAQQQYDRLHGAGRPNIRWDTQVSQILQAFGEARYRPAEPLMRKLVPKNSPLTQFCRARVAAVWSLGYLHEGKAPEDLAKQLGERLADAQSFTAEISPFRDICAVTLGRMHARSEMATLRDFASFDSVGRACRWAIAQMNEDEPYQPDPDEEVEFVNWHLQPLK